MRASTIIGFNEILKGSNTWPPKLNVDLEANLDIKIARISLATIESIEYLKLLACHQVKIWKEASIGSSHLFTKYFFNLNSLFSLSFSIKYFLNWKANA